MAYSKTNWVNENEPAINADNLNKIEAGIEDNSLQLESYGRTINELIDNKVETNAIKNEASTETDEIYSSNYLNNKLVSVGTTAPTDGRRVWFKESRNLIEPLMATATLNGVTCTNNGDDSFTLNGTATANSTFRLDQSTYNGRDNLKHYSGTYTLSCNELENGLDLRVMQNSTWISVLAMKNSNTPVTATTDKDNCFIYISIANGKSLNNLTIRPMLQKGSVATGFEPYVNPSINVDGEELNFDNYSTNEQVIGKWIDGKPLYRKVITFGALANNGNKTIPYGSSNNLIKFDIYAKNSTSGYLFKVPLGGTNYINSYVDLNSHQIVVQTNSDRTNVTDNYVIVEYTKTTG